MINNCFMIFAQILKGIVILELFLIAWISIDSNVVINTSSSMPVGIYYRTTKPISNIQVGDVVLLDNKKMLKQPFFKQGLDNEYFTLEENLLKKVVAVHNDILSINIGGLVVNGKLQSNSEITIQDSFNDILFWRIIKSYKIKENELVVLGTSLKSFDSRYFGPIQKFCVSSIVKPLITFEV